MNKRTAVSDFFKEKKKIILVITLVALLAAAVYLFFGAESQSGLSQQSAYTETETKLADMLSSIEGVGDVRVYVTETEDEITGVVVVCEGADSILVKNNVLNAVSTALNINKQIIAIYSM
ncbi:MAG: hypothetical protein LUD27_03190 [Clostridia bacterium]|nr:hypothetical protein [Clostridia bacterium]